MELHQTPEFKDWYSKAVRTQPSGTTIQKDYAMLCWIVSFSGRIVDSVKSLEAWKANYLRFRDTAVIHSHDEELFFELFAKYNMKSAADLEIDNVISFESRSFNTEMVTNPHREYHTSWDRNTACESR